MSWLELDDQILAHPKFIRAVKLGGSEAIHLWLGLRAYCGQLLTNGFIPEDMLDEVRGPTNPKSRAKAMAALKTVGLLDQIEGGLMMHDFLDWSSSREEVLQRRSSAKERKRRSRGSSDLSHTVTDHVTQEESEDVSRCDVAVGHSGVRAVSQTPARAFPSPPLQTTPEPLGIPERLGSGPDRSPAPANEPEPPAAPRPAPAKKPRREESIPVPMSDEVVIPDDVIAAKAAQWQVDEARVRAQLPEFRQFWKREGARRSPKGWIQTFGNRIDQRGKKGMLHAPIQQALGVVTTRPTRAADLIPGQMERVLKFRAEEAAEEALAARPIQVLQGGQR
jgi:hypothetical protein